MIQKSTEYGKIDLSQDVIATICGQAATECYGVVGMASQKMSDGFYSLLGKENYSKGIVVEEGQSGAIINLYLILGYGIKISEIVYEVQKRVKYVLESTLDIEVEAVNVYVQAVKVVED